MLQTLDAGLTLSPLGNFVLFCHLILNSTFFKNSFMNTIRVSNSLDPDQARQNDLGPNC